MGERGKPITDPVKLDKLFKQAKGTFEIEGIKLTEDDERNVKAIASGKMTRGEFIGKLKRDE